MCIYTHTREYMYVYIYIYTHSHAHTHTHTHTHIIYIFLDTSSNQLSLPHSSSSLINELNRYFTQTKYIFVQGLRKVFREKETFVQDLKSNRGKSNPGKQDSVCKGTVVGSMAHWRTGKKVMWPPAPGSFQPTPAIST